MNADDEYQTWLNARRAESPSVDLTDRIMATVRGSAPQPTASPRSASARKTVLQRAVPYLVCSAAVLVLAVRLYSFVSVFVIASSETDIVMTEPVEEFPDVRKP